MKIIEIGVLHNSGRTLIDCQWSRGHVVTRSRATPRRVFILCAVQASSFRKRIQRGGRGGGGGHRLPGEQETEESRETSELKVVQMPVNKAPHGRSRGERSGLGGGAESRALITPGAWHEYLSGGPTPTA
jgi:hypothetical protein